MEKAEEAYRHVLKTTRNKEYQRAAREGLEKLKGRDPDPQMNITAHSVAVLLSLGASQRTDPWEGRYAFTFWILPSFMMIKGKPHRRFSSRTIFSMRFTAAIIRLIRAASIAFFLRSFRLEGSLAKDFGSFQDIIPFRFASNTGRKFTLFQMNHLSASGR